jgi:hypothetical protein
MWEHNHNTMSTTKTKVIKNSLNRTIIRLIAGGITDVNDLIPAVREDGIEHTQGYWGDTVIKMAISRLICDGLIEATASHADTLKVNATVTL